MAFISWVYFNMVIYFTFFFLKSVLNYKAITKLDASQSNLVKCLTMPAERDIWI